MIASALFHQAHEFGEIEAEIFLILLDGDAVNSGCAFVAFDALEGFGQEFAGDPAGERVMFELDCCSHRTLG